MLRQRILTAIVLLLIVMGAIFGLSYSLFQGFLAFVLVFAAWEWSALAGINSNLLRAFFSGAILFIFYLGFSISELLLKQILTLNLVGWGIIFASIYFYPKYSRLWESRIVVALSGLLILPSCWLAILYLRAQTDFAFYIMMLLLIVAAADTGAYFSGRAFGKHKLAPQVSPNKTWEGVIGGMLASSLLVLGVALYTGFSANWLGLIAGTVALATFSVEGDLLESMLKRIKGVKDSGAILPGHGGILDRIDGIIATSPLYAFLFMNFGSQL